MAAFSGCSFALSAQARFPPEIVGQQIPLFYYQYLRHVFGAGKGVDGNLWDAALRAQIAEVVAGIRLARSIEQIFAYPPVPFAPVCIDAGRAAAQGLGYAYADIISGKRDATRVSSPVLLEDGQFLCRAWMA